MSEPATRNARTGAVALGLFAPLHCLVNLQGAALAPLAFASWLGVSFGILCLTEELGAARPLNRAGLVLFAAAFCARLLMAVAVDPALQARVQLLFAFAILGALLFWSAALMHRPRTPRVAGILGAAVAGSTLALILAAHLLVGSVTISGFSALFAAVSDPTRETLRAMTTINVILGLWGLAGAGLLWRNALRSGN